MLRILCLYNLIAGDITMTPIIVDGVVKIKVEFTDLFVVEDRRFPGSRVRLRLKEPFYCETMTVAHDVFGNYCLDEGRNVPKWFTATEVEPREMS